MTSYTLDMRGEVQRDTLLCWAAVSVMAIRSFPARGRFRHASQEDVVAYERAGIRSLLAKGKKEPKRLRDARAAFASGLANATGSPWLLGLARTKVKALSRGKPRMLSEQHFLKEIGQRKRPILIRWVYGRVNQSAGQRSGAHELIVTGYNSKTHEVRIWDPWPAANMRDPAPDRRERWIPYSRYVDPVSDGGVKVKAQHEHDEFALRLKSARVDMKSYPKLVAIPSRGRASGGGSADGGAGGFDLREPIREHMKRHVVRTRGGRRMSGPFTTGTPIPILPMSARELRRSQRQPSTLRMSRCRTVVVPILKSRKVVDSFLLMNRGGCWQEGGYSNNEIAHRVTEWRQRNARHPACRGKEFFLLSIPEQGTFFLANGYGKQANLKSLQDDKAAFEPANRALKTVIDKMATSARYRKRTTRRPVRA